ncbi:MAG: hypothetical protein EA387_11300 [Nitriliruptor sp.]|nr:MAG: hypothetical protein EA387_11300 [Nitriliruptor sp.]
MTTDTVESYNYATFDGYVATGADIHEFAAWPNLLHVGERAPDIVATSLDTGERLALSSIWKRRSVVVEFGSFT